MNDLQALGIIAGMAAVSALVTWVMVRLIGRRIAVLHPRLARMISALVAPAAMLAFGGVRAGIDAAAHPRSDWPAMAMTGTIMFALIMLAASTLTARWVLRP